MKKILKMKCLQYHKLILLIIQMLNLRKSDAIRDGMFYIVIPVIKYVIKNAKAKMKVGILLNMVAIL